MGYVDFLAPADDANAANALQHLREITTFFRILGSYPRGGQLRGLENLGPQLTPVSASACSDGKKRLGIIGFGTFGQFLGKKMSQTYAVCAWNRENYSKVADELGVQWCNSLDELLACELEVLIISTSILSFEGVTRRVAAAMEALKPGKRPLVVDVCSVKLHAKNTMLGILPESCDILCTHPMFGPESGKDGWQGLSFVYERVRCRDAPRCEEFIRWWSDQGCRMVDMTCELHDQLAAGSQFVTHFTGRVLDRMHCQSTPIDTKGFSSLLHLVENTCKDSFDLFYALYKYNPESARQLKAIQDAIVDVQRDLDCSTSGSTGSA